MTDTSVEKLTPIERAERSANIFAHNLHRCYVIQKALEALDEVKVFREAGDSEEMKFIGSAVAAQEEIIDACIIKFATELEDKHGISA